MQIVALVNRDTGRAVRAAADRTTSPHFAAALLARRLATLHYRLQLLAENRPQPWAELVEHLAVPAEVPAVAAEVNRRAAVLLSRRLYADQTRAGRHHNGHLLPVAVPQPR
ncbi:hypothetical protein [Ornithinimicrobium murale]|uniref:hypothetical protein n=1 Tax=Ornithinimicrobium murale TaxID=1050153 RepID=UPI0013B3FB75|nr:hypothetical protein [Ornithinimicrobium murale]